MDFIEINDSLTFRKSDISGVYRIGDTEECNIITNTGATYSCNWPYSTIVKLLKVNDSDSKSTGTVKNNNLWGAQSWAG